MKLRLTQINVSDFSYFIKSSFWVGLSQLFSIIAPIVVIPILISRINESNYGLYAIAFSWSIFLSIVVDYGFNISGIYYLSKLNSIDEISDKIRAIIFSKFFIFICVSLLFTSIVFNFNYFKLEKYLYLSSLIVPFSYVLNTNWIFQSMEQFKLYAFLTILSKALFIFFTILLIKNPIDYVWIIPSFGLSNILASLISLFFLRKYSLFKLDFHFHKVKFELKDSFAYFVSNISLFFSMNFFIPILGLTCSPDKVAVYSIVEKIYYGLRSIFSIYINAMLPKVAKTISSDFQTGFRLVINTYKFVILFVIGLSIILIFNSNIIVSFFLKRESVEMNTLIRLVCVGLLFLVFNTPIYLILLSLNLKNAIMKIFSTIPILSLFICYFLAKKYGIIGGVYTIIIVEFIYLFTLVLVLYKRNLIPHFKTDKA